MGGMMRPDWWGRFESPILARLAYWRDMRESRALSELSQLKMAEEIRRIEAGGGTVGPMEPSPRQPGESVVKLVRSTGGDPNIPPPPHSKGEE